MRRTHDMNADFNAAFVKQCSLIRPESYPVASQINRRVLYEKIYYKIFPRGGAKMEKKRDEHAVYFIFVSSWLRRK